MLRAVIIVMIWVSSSLAVIWAIDQIKSPHVTITPYSQFVKSVNDNQVIVISVLGDQRELLYSTTTAPGTIFRTVSPTDLGKIVDKAISDGAIVKSSPIPKPMGVWVSLLIGIIPVLLLIFFMYRLAKKNGGSLVDFTKNKAILTDPANNKIRLSDVISNPGEHDEAKDIVDFLKNPEAHRLAKAKFPRGILLEGLPGCGKTILAKAIAGEAGVPFYYVSGSDFVEMYVGVGASRVRAMFEAARKKSPSIIFIDEIDAMARSRMAGINSGSKESDHTLMQLLVELDGFEENSGVIVLAATNRADVLDSALLRPGRFDRIISIGLPNVEARKQIIELNLKRVNCDVGIDTHSLAKSTSGYSGAELANMVNEAALLVAKNRRILVTMGDLELAKDKIAMGTESPKQMSINELTLTAYHEAGHAIVGLSVPEHDPVYKVSIVPRGRALGVTVFVPQEDTYSLSKQKLNSKIATLLAGRAAEELIYGEDMVTTGASNDLERATMYARNMVTKWGFSKSVGIAQYVNSGKMEDSGHSEYTLQKIDSEVEGVLQHNYDIARNVLINNIGKLRTMADALLKYETITQEMISSIMDGTYNPNA